MSITDELRGYARGYELMVNHKLLEIADRIDAEHEKECADVWDSVGDEGVMAENGWVRLPKDADGEYIHVGDVMAYADNTKPMPVVALVPSAVFLTKDGPRFADMCRHYHAPTVEDVLREFSCVLMGKREFDGDVTEAVAEYAAKLRLAGSEDA